MITNGIASVLQPQMILLPMIDDELLLLCLTVGVDVRFEEMHVVEIMLVTLLDNKILRLKIGIVSVLLPNFLYRSL